MSALSSKIESLLMYATKPMSYKQLMNATSCQHQELADTIELMKQKFNSDDSGIQLMVHDDTLQFVTNPLNSELVESVFASEMTGELTKPALETLTIIAYRGPITKPELEMIRGVNCSLILRNLAMRGLINEQKRENELMPTYQVSVDFLQFLGINEAKELPKFDELASNELLDELLRQRSEDQS